MFVWMLDIGLDGWKKTTTTRCLDETVVINVALALTVSTSTKDERQ